MKALESGNGRELKKALQTARGRSKQLLQMVKEDVAGNSEAYDQSQLPTIKTATRALGEKCKELESVSVGR